MKWLNKLFKKSWKLKPGFMMGGVTAVIVPTPQLLKKMKSKKFKRMKL